MQQHTEQSIVGIAQDISNHSFELDVQMIRLDTVQDAVARLMERIEDIQHNGWDKDRGAAYLSIGEISRTVRLIDMAFRPLKREMEKTAKELEVSSSNAFELIVRENKKADAGTSTSEI